MFYRPSIAALILVLALSAIVGLVRIIPRRIMALEREMQEELTQQFGLPVSYQRWSIKPNYWSFSLKSRIQDLTISGLKIGEVRASVSLWRTFYTRNIVFEELSFKDLSLHLLKHNSKFTLLELETHPNPSALNQAEATIAALLRWLKKQGTINFYNVNLAFLYTTQPVGSLNINELMIKGSRYEASLSYLDSSFNGSAVKDIKVQGDLLSQEGQLTASLIDAALIPNLLLLLDNDQLKISSLKNLQMRGKVRDLNFKWRESFDGASAQVEHLNIDAHADFPGVSDLSGELSFGPQGGFIKLTAQNLTLNSSALWEETLTITDPRVDLKYQREASGATRVELESLKLKYAGAELSAQGSFDQAKEAALEDGILRVALTLGPLNFKPLLKALPLQMPRSLREWLQTSLKQGFVNDAQIHYQAPLRELLKGRPLDGLQLHAALRDCQVRFAPDWPEVHAPSGALTLEKNQLKLSIKQGQSSGLYLEELNLDVANLYDAAALNVNFKVSGDLLQGQSYVRASPLRLPLAILTDDVKLHGPMNLDASLIYPLNLEPIIFRGQLGTTNTSLSHEASGLVLNSIRGTVKFDQGSVKDFRYSYELEQKAGQLEGHWENNGFAIQSQHPNIDGIMLWPQNPRIDPMFIKLKTLKFNPNPAPKSPEHLAPEATTPQRRLKATDWAGVIFDCDSCQVGAAKLNRLHAVLERIPQGQILSAISLESNGLSLRGFKGSWLELAEGAKSNLEIDIDIKDSQEVLRSLSKPQFLRAAYGSAHVSLTWPGAPWQLSKFNQKGSMAIELKEGYLNQSDPLFAGLVNIMNFNIDQAVDQKLPVKSIDLDLAIKEQSLKVLCGHFDFGSVELESRGDIDLESEQLDQTLIVIPNVAAPLPAVMLGLVNPIVGAGLWLNGLNTPASEQWYNRMVGQTYTLKGTLADPQFKLIDGLKKPFKAKSIAKNEKGHCQQLEAYMSSY